MSGFNSRNHTASPEYGRESEPELDMGDLYATNNDEVDRDKSASSRPSTTRRKSILDTFKEKVGLGPKIETNEDDEDDMIKEAMVVRTMRVARNRLIANSLVGEVTISRGGGVLSSSVICEVDEDSKSTVEDIYDSELDSKSQRIVTMLDGAINNLVKRAKKWEGSGDNIIDSIRLSREYSLEIPLVGLLGFAMSVVLEVSLKSLLEYRRRNAEIVKGSGSVASSGTSWGMMRSSSGKS
jgi:hypothetical protein